MKSSLEFLRFVFYAVIERVEYYVDRYIVSLGLY